MGRLKFGVVGVVVLGSLQSVANAQTSVRLDTKPETPAVADLGGTATLDIITLRAGMPGAPLRFGNVVPGSERVQLNNRLLVSGTDYAMDYATGVVYLKGVQKPGDSVTVSYRYKSGVATSANTSNFAGLGAMKFSLLPGAMNLTMGLGITERAADGSILRSNLYGGNNSFKFGQGGNLKGIFLYGERTATQNQAGLNFDQNAKPGEASKEEGKSTFLVQNFRSALMGGEITADYQDISKNFTGYSALKQSGVSDQDIARLTNERGLTRNGFGFKDVKVGGMAFTDGNKTVRDATGGIRWRNYGMANSSLKMSFSSQQVDNTFQRFKDLSEADREQLSRERGMSRENFAGEFNQKLGKLGFSDSSIQDDISKKGIRKREMTLDTSKMKLGFGEQEVDNGFSRIGSLMGAEQAAYGREAGVKRQWSSLSTTLSPKVGSFSFSQLELASSGQKYAARDLAYTGKTWSIEKSVRQSDLGFTRMNALQDAEMDASIKKIGAMYGPSVATRPEDRSRFLGSAGLTRDFTSLQAGLFKDMTVRFDDLKLRGQKDGGDVQTVSMNSKRYQASFRTQNLGSQFSEVNNMMDFERQRLGTLLGMKRTDLAFSADLGRARSFSFSQMEASTSAGGVQRTSLGYKAKGVELTAGARTVGSGFATASQLIDSEASLLSTFQGFAEKDVNLKWQVNSRLHLETFFQDAKNDTTFEERKVRNTIVDWTPDNNTRFNYTNLANGSTDPMKTLFSQSVERISLSRNLGKYGKLDLLQEQVNYDGSNNTQNDSRKSMFAWETKLNPTTSFRTEQTRTEYGNGTKEDISANTVSTELNKRTGVSVTEAKVDRTGENSDETKRNYGFWYDLGSGLRLSYGYVRQMNGETTGTSSSSVSFGQNAQRINPDQVGSVQQGKVGDIMMGGAYGTNQWESGNSVRTQSFSKVALSTAKPLKYGMLTDLKFNFGLDTAADYSRWTKEDRQVGFSGKYRKSAFSFDYHGQMAPSGDRGIDRTYKFQTDGDEKSWLRGGVAYKVRTLPNNQQIMVRDFNVTAQATKRVSVTNQLQTNPEVFRGDVILGSVPQASRSNKWQVDYKQDKNFTFGASWQQLLNDSNNARSTTGGINMKLFEASKSPLNLFYGLEEVGGNVTRRLTQRYTISYEQKPSANQMFSFFLGNVAYEHSIADGALRNNITFRLDYQFRF